MKILLFILSTMLSQAFAPVHDVRIAIFHIKEAKTSININITFDLEDFASSFKISPKAVNRKNVQQYLDQNTSFQFNTQVAKLKVAEVKIVRDHIRVKGYFENVVQQIKSLKVKNTCLNDIPKHSNIVQVDLNNESKDYRMHQKRTVINLSY